MPTGDFELTTEELRVVVRYVVVHAEDVLPVFESAVPDDPRPRDAVAAAHVFADGGPRTRLQRVAATAAHRAAREAPTEAARLAAQAAGDAAAAAYLHPIARATQVGHVLRAAACAARISELTGGRADLAGSQERATDVLVDVLRRYPSAPAGRSRVAELMSELDRRLRA